MVAPGRQRQAQQLPAGQLREHRFDGRDAREEESGEVYLQLPGGFRYRVVSRVYEPMSDGHPTPGIFDGTG